MRFMKLVAFGVAVLALLAGCATTQVQQAQVRPAREIPTGADSKPIQFRKVVAKLRRGEPIGQAQVGVLCIPTETIEWKGGRVNIADEEFTDVFREELEKANYTVVGDPNALFEDPSAWKAELLVAGLINKVEANACFPLAGFGNYRDSKGAAFIKVHWQIYGQLERKVIYDTTTEGSYRMESAGPGGMAKMLTNAFAVATQNLLADEGFHKLVLRQKSTLAAPTVQPPLVLAAPTQQLEGVSNARSAAVTVFAGMGHGSGFIVSPEGYVLTNEHVVKAANFVKVKLANGREVLGDVIRSDAARDIALIKLNEKNLPAATLRMKSTPQIGDEVYAIGTPLRESLEATVSRGIVSSYRDDRGMKFIQSDVQIHPGNSGGPLVDKDGKVVGIAASGYSRSGVSQNLNFFIPIDDAIERIGLTFK